MDEPLARPRRRRTASERTQWVERFRASGLTQVEFAEKEGLNLGTFRQWLYRSQTKALPAAPPRFHELRVENLTSSDPIPWSLELAVGKHVTLRWHQAPAADEILKIVRELRPGC
jgi:hypothetical protein